MHAPIVLNILNFSHELIQFLGTAAHLSQGLAKNGLTDFAKGMEHFYRDLAELIFNEKFTLAASVNQEFFDIESNSYYIQVTIQKDAKKIKKNLDSFLAGPMAGQKQIYFMLASDRPSYKDPTFKKYSSFDWRVQILGLSEIANKCCTDLHQASHACKIARMHLVPDNSKANQAANKQLLVSLNSIAVQIPVTKQLVIDTLTRAKKDFSLMYPQAEVNRLELNGTAAKLVFKMLDGWTELINTDLARVQGNPIDGDFAEMIKNVQNVQSSTQDDPLTSIESVISRESAKAREWVNLFASAFAKLDPQANLHDVNEMARKLYSQKHLDPAVFAEKTYKEQLGTNANRK